MTLAADLWFSIHCTLFSLGVQALAEGMEAAESTHSCPREQVGRGHSPPTARLLSTAAPAALTWTPAEESSSDSGSRGGTLGSKLLLKEDTECMNAMAAGLLAEGSGAARETRWELSSGPDLLHEEEPSETMGTSQWGRRPHCH